MVIQNNARQFLTGMSILSTARSSSKVKSVINQGFGLFEMVALFTKERQKYVRAACPSGQGRGQKVNCRANHARGGFKAHQNNKNVFRDA